MLESMRKHAQGWLAKVILGAIILSFALWGVGDYFTGNQIETVAEVDGDVINNVEFSETYQRQLSNYRNMLGEQFTKELADQLGVKNETIQTMVNRRLMLLEAKTMGLVTPDQAVLGTVESNPAFQEADKGFNASRYHTLVRQMGFASPRDYENYLRQNIMIDTLQKAISESAIVSDEEVKARFEAKFEKRVLAALIVNPESLKASVDVSADQARAWYDTHEAMYQSPLKVELQAVDINKDNLVSDLVVSEADIEQAYADRQSEFGTAEKRRASHILVRLSPDAAENVKKAAQEKIQAAQKRIQAGESFAAVAKDVSDDVTSSEGGDLGFFAKGAMVPEFEDEVFEKLKIGEVSDVVTTQFGLHLIQLDAIQEAEVKPLAEVHDKIRDDLMAKMASEEAFKLSQDLDNALGMEDSLQAAAKAVNLPVRNLGTMSREKASVDPLLSTSKELQAKAFSSSPGDEIKIIEIADGHFVALEVLQRIAPSTMAYEDVVTRVRADVRADEAAKKAQALAEEMLTAAMAGEKIDSLAQKFAQPKYISKAVRSNGEGDDASWLNAVLASSFRVPEFAWVGKTIATPQGIAVVYVQAVEGADDKAFQAEAENVREEALKAKGAVRFARWMASMRDRHDITVNDKVLSRF